MTDAIMMVDKPIKMICVKRCAECLFRDHDSGYGSYCAESLKGKEGEGVIHFLIPDEDKIAKFCPLREESILIRISSEVK